eukprot:gene5820-237_t
MPRRKKRDISDFILIGEFCEISGPIAIMTIPNVEYDFLNEIVLAVLTSDLQSNTISHANHFELAQDAQSILDFPEANLFVLSQFVNFCDLKARGYSRTFCFSYLTQDQYKLTQHSHAIIEELNTICKVLHYANAQVFQIDLKSSITQLRLERGFLVTARDLDDEKSQELTDTTYKLSRHEDMLRIIESFLSVEKPQVYEYFARLEGRGAYHVRSRTHTLNSSQQSTPVKERGGSFHSQIVNCSDSPKPQHDPAEKKLRPLQDLISRYYNFFVSCLEKLLEYYRRSVTVLAMSAEESSLLSPPAMLLTIGRCIVLNFYESNRTSSFTRDINSSLKLSPARTRLNEPLFQFDTASQSFLLHGKVNDSMEQLSRTGSFASTFHDDLFMLASHRDELCSRSIVFSDTDSMYSASDHLLEDFQSCTDLTKKQSIEEDVKVMKQFADQSNDNNAHESLSLLANEEKGESKYDCANATVKKRFNDEDDIILDILDSGADSSDISTANEDKSVQPEKPSDRKENFSRNTHVRRNSDGSTVVPQGNGEIAVAFQYGSGENTQFTSPARINPSPIRSPTSFGADSMVPLTRQSSFISHVVSSTNFSFQSAADHISYHGKNKPGAGIVHLLQRFSFMKHLVFALLHGRCVIVMGDERREDEVRAIVRVLWFFVVGHSYWNKVIPWRSSSPLTFKDMSTIKLVGMPRSCVVRTHRPLLNFISILDLDEETFTGIHYCGSALDLPFSIPPKESSTLASTPWYDVQNQRATMKELGVKGSDADIVKYFAETIKRQQMAHDSMGFGTDGGSGGGWTVNLNYQPARRSFSS